MEGAYYNGQYLNRLERLGYAQAEIDLAACRQAQGGVPVGRHEGMSAHQRLSTVKWSLV